jgi:hypothetical protein
MVRPCNRGKFKAARIKCSLLCLSFNRLWAMALNARAEHGVTHFAMCHDDVVPSPGWADVLIDELDRTGADVCSAVVPIKDPRGLTSTGIRNAGTGSTRRLTMREIFDLPETFGLRQVSGIGEGDLLAVNTGLWVCRLDAPWVERFPGFAMTDAVRRVGDRWEAGCVPEDWQFSEWLWRQGLKAAATRKVALAHVDDDGKEYRSDSVWGEWETDLGDTPL